MSMKQSSSRAACVIGECAPVVSPSFTPRRRRTLRPAVIYCPRRRMVEVAVRRRVLSCGTLEEGVLTCGCR